MREKTYRIGEAADMLHLKSYVLRFWEEEFPQLSPLRTKKLQRLYTDQDIALLHRIKQLLHEQGMTIEGARRILAAADSPASAAPPRPLNAPQPAEVLTTGNAPDAFSTALKPENGKNPTINRAVVREMREELLALRHMLTADE